MELQSPDKPYLLNAFSANLLVSFPAQVQFTPLSTDAARELLVGGFLSAVGHPDTAALFSRLLGLEVPVRRVSATLPPGAWAVLGQYRGARLPEGVVVLPDDAVVEWFQVMILRHQPIQEARTTQ